MSARELRIGEALAARLCHELVSPVGAIANGVEILAEDAGFAADAAALIGQSAGEASRRLQFYRLAYGALSPLGADVARQATLELFKEGRCRCEWHVTATPIPNNFVKLTMNLLIVAAAALPRGGMIAPVWGDGGLVVTARGTGARIEGDPEALLSPEIELAEINPKSVQTVFAAALARELGCRLSIDLAVADCVSFAAVPLARWSEKIVGDAS